MYQDINFLEFQRRFATEQDCYDFLFRQRWPNGFVCPKCGQNKAYYLKNHGLYQCANCHHQASVTAGTIFHKTRIPLVKWFWMIFFLARNKSGYSILNLQKLLDIGTYKTALLMANKIREAMAHRDTCYKLSGIIELDDSYFGGKNVSGKRGRGASNKSKVFVAVSVKKNKPQYAKMRVVERLDERNLKKFTSQDLNPHATIRTDGFSSYKTLDKSGYDNWAETLETPENASKFLPWVHILISNSKAILRGVHHGVSPKHLHRYLTEFCYRFNRRYSEPTLFNRLLKSCVLAPPITLKQIRT